MNKVVAEFSDKAALEFYDAEFILVSGRSLQFLKPGNYMLSSVLKGNTNTPDIGIGFFSFNSPLGKPNVGAFYGHSTMHHVVILDTRVDGNVHTLHFENFVHLSITALDIVKQTITPVESIKATWSQPYVDPLLDAKKELDKLRQVLEDKNQEIDVLRRYGNKDCTAMADEELKRIRQDTNS